jgi:hypothetical protein
MTKEEWKQTNVYRNGLFHYKLGKLLMKPTSRMSAFVTLGKEFNMDPQVIFKIIDERAETEHGQDS